MRCVPCRAGAPRVPRSGRGAARRSGRFAQGVVVGAFYLVVGVVLALTREGFDLGRHPLSLLTLGELGWVHTLNLILSGITTIAAAVGFARAMRGARAARRAGVLIGIFGANALRWLANDRSTLPASPPSGQTCS